MEKLIENWRVRMKIYRKEADEAKSPNQRIKSLANFMMLRDCIRELEQLTLFNVSIS